MQTELREAKVEPISAEAMVVEIMRAKQLDVGDAKLRADHRPDPARAGPDAGEECRA